MERVVFTNGCFDLIHPGHVKLLRKARALGTKLIVGLNSDRSVRAIKGSPRPFMNQKARAAVLSELRSVDEVRIFDENTPERLIREIKPDVLVKGGDWSIKQIVGADFVLKNGGEVFSIPFEGDFSTTKIIEKIKSPRKKNSQPEPAFKNQNSLIENSLSARIEILTGLLSQGIGEIARCEEMILEALTEGKKILVCIDENGVDSYPLDEAVNLYLSGVEASKTSGIDICQRLESFARSGDLFIAAVVDKGSTEIMGAVMKARQIGCRTVGLTGAEGKKLAALCDAVVFVPDTQPCRIQEAHQTIFHIWGEAIKAEIKKQNNY